jgi:hypothetical protein
MSFPTIISKRLLNKKSKFFGNLSGSKQVFLSSALQF